MKMDVKNKYRLLKIRRRPWYFWLLRFVWLTWIIFWAEVAWGSWKELEPRASFIALGMLLFSLGLGIVFWFWGRNRTKKPAA